MTVMVDFGLDSSKEYVINDEFGLVLSPRFAFNTNGYLDNFSNFDFYKWVIKEDRLYLLDTLGNETAFFTKIDNNWVGEYLKSGQKIKLKVYDYEFDISNRNADLTNRLKNTKWRFRNNDGHIISNEVWLCEDGVIRGYSHPNEFYWKVDEEGLGFYNTENVKTTNFKNIIENELKFIGDFLISKGSTHTLEYLSSESDIFKSETFSSRSHLINFNNPNPTLIITFNSIGTLYNGRDSLWEFYNLPFQFGLNYIRYGESLPAWYVDKSDSIIFDLDNAVKKFAQVLLLGGSAGGYASLVFGEILARKNPNIKFSTFSLNPQTTLDLNDTRYLLENYNEPQRSALPPEFILQKSQLHSLDFKEYLDGKNLKNIKHHIFYDELNVCERFFIDRLPTDRVIKNGLPINGGHADSLGAIMGTRKIHDAIYELIK